MIRFFPVLLLSILSQSFSLDTDKKDGKTRFLSDYVKIKYPKETFDQYLLVEIKQQKMHLIKNGELLKSYLISSAYNGLGNVKNSECTPFGLHKIRFKIGKNVPLGGILNGSNFSGRIAPIYISDTTCHEDLVTTRAMRLEGLEQGKNKGGETDTYQRHIYIHGTPEEGRLGQAVSHGCIRMKNQDIVELYELVDVKTKVLILNI